MAAPLRLALVVHPTRPIDAALATLQRWADERGAELLQLATGNGSRQVAPLGDVGSCGLVVAVGGDGTVLTALRAAAKSQTPVLGVACGSLGALAAVSAGELENALDRYHAGDWTPRKLPALGIGDGNWAVNDFVVVRRAGGQLMTEVSIDGDLYVRAAGDGMIVATALGSSAYTMAAGGPIVASGSHAFVCTPLAMHGGSAPPIVVPADATLSIVVLRSNVHFDTEIDGHIRPLEGLRFDVTLHEDKLTLVELGPPGRGLEPLRRRRLIIDSPRVLARDERATG
jgi:NAD+ kinase